MDNTEIRNERAAKFIWNNSLQLSSIPFTWGLDFRTVNVVENGTSFHLGKINSLVIIQHQEGGRYSVTVCPDYGENVAIYDSILLKDLVPLIDATVRYGTKHYGCICERFRIPENIAVREI